MDEVWPAALSQLETQMTSATFEAWLQGSRALSFENGVMVIGVKNEQAIEWLEHRLAAVIDRTLVSILGHPVEVQFKVASPTNGDAPPLLDEIEAQFPQDLPADMQAEILTPGEKVAQADHIAAFFGRGSPGYGPVTHYTSFFWMQILGEAFLLWKYLDSLDSRGLANIAPNFWSPVFDSFSFANLAKRLNRKKSGHITGEPRECNFSRAKRIEQEDPLTSADDCCWKSDYQFVHHKAHPDQPDQIMCMRWHEGLLEKLRQHHLLKIELPSPAARKPRLQVWRMLPIITPAQLEAFLITDTIQEQHEAWLREHGKRFGLDDRDPYGDWKKITESSLVPLMPGYRLAEIEDNYETRQAYQEFVSVAVKNPNYLPCMEDNGDDA